MGHARLQHLSRPAKTSSKLKQSRPAPTPSPGSNTASLASLETWCRKGKGVDSPTDAERAVEAAVEDGREEYGVLWQNLDLSEAFPLGERSGVNSRGECGPPWDGPVATPGKLKEDKEAESGDKMSVDESPEILEESKKEGTPLSVKLSSYLTSIGVL